MKFLVVLYYVLIGCFFSYGSEIEKSFVLEDFKNLPEVDISGRKSWNHQINDSDKFRYAEERWESFFSGDVNAKLSKLTLSEKYILFQVSWRDGGKIVLDSIINAAQSVNINLEKDRVFALGVKYDYVDFSKWMLLKQEEAQEGVDKWVDVAELEEYKSKVNSLVK